MYSGNVRAVATRKNVISKRHLVMSLRWFLQKKLRKILREKLFINAKEKTVIIQRPYRFLSKNRVQREKKTTRITTKTITRETMKSQMCQLIRTKMIRLITMVRQSRIPEMNPVKILIRQRNPRLTKKNSRMWMKNMRPMLLLHLRRL